MSSMEVTEQLVYPRRTQVHHHVMYRNLQGSTTILRGTLLLMCFEPNGWAWQPHILYRHVLYSAILTAFVACVLDCWEGVIACVTSFVDVQRCWRECVLYGMLNVMACQNRRCVAGEGCMPCCC